MRLGVMIEGQEGLTWDRWRRLARATEDLGFASLWRSDHFSSLFGDRAQPALETWISLAMAAQETKRVRLGPLVCSMTFRHPSLLARMAAQVDVLSGGRLEVGVGAGWNVMEHETFGIEFPPLKERMDMLEEGVQVMQALWAEGKASFSGRHYRLKDATCHPKPAQTPLPLVIGGTGEKRTLLIAARYASHWNAVGVDPKTFAEKRAVLERHCAAVGRDPAEIRRSVMGGFILGRSDADVRGHFQRVVAAMPPLSQLDAETALSGLKGRGWLVGTVNEVVEQLGAFEDAGVGEFMLQHHDQEDLGVLELIAGEILPQVA